jgi:hypothetical protein
MVQGLAANGPNPQRQWFFGRMHHDEAGSTMAGCRSSSTGFPTPATNRACSQRSALTIVEWQLSGWPNGQTAYRDFRDFRFGSDT